MAFSETSLASDADASRERGFYRRYGKRGIDIAGALILLPVFAILIVPLWLALRLGGGSGFYGHRRVGRDGRVFACWKLRTMCPEADRVFEDHLRRHPGAAAEWAATFKLTADPRVTPLGRILRRTSLDELPQIWNVLCGEMSLVGPRPVTEAELPFYAPNVRSYLSMRPGMTGLWQVEGRGDGNYPARVRLDRRYRRRVSLFLDLSLILRTAPVMVFGRGR